MTLLLDSKRDPSCRSDPSKTRFTTEFGIYRNLSESIVFSRLLRYKWLNLNVLYANSCVFLVVILCCLFCLIHYFMFLFLLNKTYMLPDVFICFYACWGCWGTGSLQAAPWLGSGDHGLAPNGPLGSLGWIPVMFVGVGPYGSTIVWRCDQYHKYS